jgi:hypothetical protein
MLIASFSRANLDGDGKLLEGLDGIEIYSGAVTVLMRLVFLLFAEERGLLPLDDEVYSGSYAISSLRQQLQAEQDLHGDEPLERKSAAWFRCLALFRVVHGGTTHESLRIPPYGGRLFDPDRFPFLEGRSIGEHWKEDPSSPIPVDDLTMLAILTRLQVLEISEGGVREARQLSYRTLEVEQIGHVYEGLLDHSVRRVDSIVLGLVGKPGEEPEVSLEELELAAAGSRSDFIKWLVKTTSKTEKFLTKCLDTPPGETDRQLLGAAVDNDEALVARILPFVHLLIRDLRELPKVLLPGAHYATQTSTRREGGVEYTTKDLADEVARYALEPLVYSPGPQDTSDESQWKLRSSAEILDLKVCDPAVGSGAILVAAGRYLASRLVEAWDREDADEAVGEADEVLVNARRAIADRCLYGVDRDPLATEMAKLSLWLTTMAKDRPFTFLDHAIRTGDSLLGVTDLEQIRWMHLDPSEGRRIHHSLFDYTAKLEPLVATALARRRRLEELRVITIRDAEDKARLLQEADEDLELLRLIGDLVVGASLSTASLAGKEAEKRLLAAAGEVATLMLPDLDREKRALLRERSAGLASQWLNAGRPATAPIRTCLHWPLDFPEVFLAADSHGFDAMVGNPPFIGGQKITGAAGEDVRDHVIRWVANGKKGSADLVAYFFLRASTLARSFGLLATNTIAQGDTSEVGLAQLIDHGWVIHRAVSSTPWPGRASLEIAKVWGYLAGWQGKYLLDQVQVQGIDEMLYGASHGGWRKEKLHCYRDFSFQGSILLGMGFTISPEEAQLLIRQDSRNGEVILPFLGGEDVNQFPEQIAPRWVINFFDWSEEKARSYPDCFAIVEREVKPQRQELRPNGEFKQRAPLPQKYWIYAEKRPKLYQTIMPLERVLVLCQTSKVQLPVFVDPGQVFSNKLVVFPYDDDFHFGVLSSMFHWRWVLRHGSSMRTDPVYTPSDVFETFPQPQVSLEVSEAGRHLNDFRSAHMISVQEGLTTTYNRVHDPEEQDPAIVELRSLHQKLDIAVRDAYGWMDLDLEHGFHQVRGQGIRFTFSATAAVEVLDRLLELNRERFETEIAQGLHHSKSQKVKKKKPKSSKSRDGDALTLFGNGDANDEEVAE